MNDTEDTILELNQMSDEELNEVLKKIEHLEALEEVQKEKIRALVVKDRMFQKEIADLEELLVVLTEDESLDELVLDEDSSDFGIEQYLGYRNGRNATLVGGLACLVLGAITVPFISAIGGILLLGSGCFHMFYHKALKQYQKELSVKRIMVPNHITDLRDCKIVLHQKRSDYEAFLKEVHDERAKERSLEERLREASFLKADIIYEQQRRDIKENERLEFYGEPSRDDALDMGTILQKVRNS